MSSSWASPSDRENGLPSIRRSGLLDTHQHRATRITTIDDSAIPTSDYEQTRVRFSSAGHNREVRNRMGCGPTYHPVPRPPSPPPVVTTTTTTHHVGLQNGYKESYKIHGQTHNIDLHEQVTMLKTELERRDKLIQELTSIDASAPKFEYSKIEEVYSAEKLNALASCKSELAAYKVKVDGLTSELFETRAQLESREEQMKQLRLEGEILREKEAKQSTIAETMRQRIIEFEAQFGGLEGAANRGELAVSTLQGQLKEANHKILELESRLRTHMTERESAEMRSVSWEKKYSEFTSRFISLMGFETGCDFDPESIICKISEIMQENASLRGKVATLKEYANSAEVEMKACRETIARLVTEAEKEQKASTKFSIELDSLRLERDSSIARFRELELEIGTYKERIHSMQSAWSSSQKQLEEREAQFAQMEHRIRESSSSAQSYEIQMRSFKQTMCDLLRIDGYPAVELYEESIRERITAIVGALKDKTDHILMLEAKITTLSEQLSRQYEMQKSAESRTKRLDVEYFEMKERIRKYEEDLASAAAFRDGLRSDKEKYLRSLERLARAMKVETIAVDMGFDMVIDTLVSRAEQLFGMESESLQERKTHIYNLQRKVKSLKEQLESRDLHLDLLRKKVAGLEEHLAGKSDLEREKDNETIKSQKLQKLCERYKHELHEATLELNEMKARMMEASEFRTQTVEQERTIEELESKVGQLETIRHKQAKKITGLKTNLDSQVDELNTKNETVGNTIGALSSELRTTKSALDEITKRERQLLDLRQVVARMLGLDINSLAVPDYEIISRLEKLILAHQSSGVAMATVDTVIGDMEAGFKAGYQGAGRVLHRSQNSATIRSRSPNRKVHIRTRPRSMSPGKRDNRVY